MNPREIVAAGFWTASVVKMGQFGFEAYSQTYKSDFGPGNSNTAASSTDVTAGTKAGFSTISKIPLVGGVLAGAGQWLQNLFAGGGLGQGASSIPPDQYQRLEKLPAPPKAIVAAIRANADGQGTHGPQLANAANQLQTWGLTHGWKYQDVRNFLKVLNVHLF